MFQKCSVAHLVDHYLGNLYPDYASHTRMVLVRQARDLLLCTYHGDLCRFESDFLAPAAIVITQVKDNHKVARLRGADANGSLYANIDIDCSELVSLLVFFYFCFGMQKIKISAIIHTLL